jgi:hypothetical protein
VFTLKPGMDLCLLKETWPLLLLPFMLILLWGVLDQLWLMLCTPKEEPHA